MSQLELTATCFSHLDMATPTLELQRYPPQEASGALQAWDAADEYLLQQLKPVSHRGRPLLIFNDNFGALACALHHYSPYSISDSYLSQLATQHNLHLNQLAEENVSLLDSLAALPAAPTIVMIKIPKTRALLEQQLVALRQVVQADTVVMAAAKARDIHTSTLQLFEQLLGPTHTTLAWKKARIIHCQVSPETLTAAPFPATLTQWPLEETPYHIANHANVFSRGSLDIGARFFIAHLPQNLSGTIVDLGCGNGVIGLMALQHNPQAEVLFTDESYMAVASSRLNVAHNRPQDQERCRFSVNHALTGIPDSSIQSILCNPPFHQLHAITDQLAWEMFCDAKRCLRSGGELRVIGNRHLDYFQKLKRLFGNCQTLAANPKFVILRAVK